MTPRAGLTRLVRWARRVLPPLAAMMAAAVTAPAPALVADARAAAVQVMAATPTEDSADRSRQAWREARGLADAGRHTEALAVLDRALARDPADADLRWLKAAVTGWTGRHAEAVTLYERLIADRPDLARDIRGDLGSERLAAGDTRGALADLDLRLADAPHDRDAAMARALALSYADRLRESLAAYDALLASAPDDLDVMMERARVLSWMGRNGAAAAAYRAVIARQPENRRARLGLAMNENWQGLHRRAAARLETLVTEPEPDAETLKALAFARYWGGEPDRARQALDDYLARQPGDREALDLRRQMERDRSPSLTGGFGRANDSDRQRIEATTVDLSLPLARQNTLEVGWRRDDVRDDGGHRRPVQTRAGLVTAWSGVWTTRVVVGAASPGNGAATTALAELSATWKPEDRLRIDAGVSRDLVLARLSLDNDIRATTWVEGADWNASERLTLRASMRQRSTSDGNRSHAEALSAALRTYADRRWSLVATFGAEQLHTRLDLDHGYYDPAGHAEWGPGVEAAWTPREALGLSAAVRAGSQRERGGQAQTFFNISGRAEWSVAPGLALSLTGGRSNSNLATTAGYERRSWAFSVTRGF